MSISVAIPIGPHPENQQWLDECLESINQQTLKPGHVVIIDDMSNVNYEKLKSALHVPFTLYRPPWHIGVGTAFNFGVMLSPTDLVFMLGSDDTLEPECLRACVDTYYKLPEDKRDLTYYYVGVKYMDTGVEQHEICNAAMVSKKLWQHNGGFPVEASTAPDAALGSILIRHPEAGLLCSVSEKRTLYNYRNHPGTDTVRHAAWYESIIQQRHLLTLEWQRPAWGRYV